MLQAVYYDGILLQLFPTFLKNYLFQPGCGRTGSARTLDSPILRRRRKVCRFVRILPKT
jgi:hypothetical protein